MHNLCISNAVEKAIVAQFASYSDVNSVNATYDTHNLLNWGYFVFEHMEGPWINEKIHVRSVSNRMSAGKGTKLGATAHLSQCFAGAS